MLGLPVLALLLWLGFWQLDRAAEKRAFADAYAAAQAVGPRTIESAEALLSVPRHTRVVAEGRYRTERQVLLDAQTHEGRVGYRVWTPLELDNGDWLLVDRGWTEGAATRAELPEVGVDTGPRRVTGLRAPLPEPGLRLGEPDAGGDAWPRRLVWPDAAALERALGRTVPAALILLDAEVADGFVRDWAPAGMPPERHVGYAVQWFSLAAALVVIALVLLLRDKRRHE